MAGVDRLQRLFNDPQQRDVLHFLRSRDADECGRLYALADRVRRKHVGDGIHLRAIIEFSNFCRNDCLYCGLRRSNPTLRRRRMPVEAIIARCRRAAALGFRTVVLQSGEDPFYGREAIAGMVRDIRGETGLVVTLALGEKSEAEIFALKLNKAEGGKAFVTSAE